jgi:DNA invertase Pin-like site-specific DNA recombinase
VSQIKPTRAVDYLRVSDTRGRSETLISFDVQAGYCAELRNKRGWDLVEEIRDPDRKGSTLDRPGLNRARQLIKDGKADVIVVWRLDRFARSMLKALMALQDVLDDGGAVVSCHPQEQLMDTSTAIGRGIAALLFALNEEELDKIRANWRNAAEHAVAKGWYMGGNGRGRVLGYIKEPKSPLRPHPTEAPIIAGLFQRAAAGESYVQLRRYLMANGIEVSVTSIGRLLQNRAYLGELHWGDAPGAKRAGRTLVHEPIVNLNAHEPIVDEVTFRRAQRSGRKFGLGREKVDPRLLSGLARCAGCRSTMVVVRNGARAPYYTCRKASLERDRCAGPASIVADVLEKHVEGRFLDWLAHELPRRRAQDDQGHLRLRELDTRIALAEEQILDFNRREVQDMLGADWLDGLKERYDYSEQLKRERKVLLDALDIEAFEGITEPDDYLRLRAAGEIDRCRRAIASMLDIVFVRTSKVRGPRASSDAVVAERVFVVYRPDGDEIVLPRPGVRTDWRPFPFGDEPEPAAGEAVSEVG